MATIVKLVSLNEDHDKIYQVVQNESEADYTLFLTQDENEDGNEGIIKLVRDHESPKYTIVLTSDAGEGRQKVFFTQDKNSASPTF